jgi:hypothetical protein
MHRVFFFFFGPGLLFSDSPGAGGPPLLTDNDKSLRKKGAPLKWDLN